MVIPFLCGDSYMSAWSLVRMRLIRHLAHYSKIPDRSASVGFISRTEVMLSQLVRAQ
jgi:hypothetical protein